MAQYSFNKFILLATLLIGVPCIIFAVSHKSSSQPPNIVFILTDDQDKELQSLDSMPKLRRLIADTGVRFPNMFVTTPVCCPSRSAIITGRFAHNTGAKTNCVVGGCSSVDWQKLEETRTFPKLLHKAGYTTFFAGKYLNQYGYPDTGGAEHVPPGWDWWNGHIDRTYENYYYNYNISINGSNVQHGDRLPDYLTTVIQQKAMEFLRYTTPNKPFFMMLCPTAAHAPFTSLPQYNVNFTGKIAPRTPSYNSYAGDKHWMVRVQPKGGMTKEVMDAVDEIFRERWRTLQSVDQMIEDLVGKLEIQGTLDNTIFIYSADNGFHLGQFVLPVDKRQPYEFDVKVPMILAGPRIAKGIIRSEPVQSIDIAPTILEYAGVAPPSSDWFDGRSIVQLAASDPITEKHKISWRGQVLIEHWGDHGDAGIDDPKMSCPVRGECYVIDSTNNSYSCVRRLHQYLGDAKNDLYCEFWDDEGFREYYDLSVDPFQLINSIGQLPSAVVQGLHDQLKALERCRGESCRQADMTAIADS